jgi:uncharacterized protein (DUF433 family)
MSAYLSSNPEVMHGAVCFKGTRVEAKTLFDTLEEGGTIDDFLDDFPTVSREQVVGLLEQIKHDSPRFAETTS